MHRCPRPLESLLAARCSPNLLGSPARAPLSIAVASIDQESVDELLEYGADPNVASEAAEPPLCSAVRSRCRGIVRALLLHRADINICSQTPTPLVDEGRRGEGLTPLELAEGDEYLVDLLTDVHSS